MFIVNCRSKCFIILYFVRKLVILQNFSLSALLLTFSPGSSFRGTSWKYVPGPFYITLTAVLFYCQTLHISNVTKYLSDAVCSLIVWTEVWTVKCYVLIGIYVFLNYTMFFCIYVSVHKVMKTYFALQGESSPFFVQEFLLQDLRKLFSA